MCPPDFYGIEYEINPWMKRERNADASLAATQWIGLRDRLQALGCEVKLLAAQPKLPDLGGPSLDVFVIDTTPIAAADTKPGQDRRQYENIQAQDIAAQRDVVRLTDDDAVAKSRVALADTAFKAAEKNFQEREKQTKEAREAKDKREGSCITPVTRDQSRARASARPASAMAATATDIWIS